MKKILASLVGAAIVTAVCATVASAADFEVHMLNKGKDGAMVFEPSSSRSPRATPSPSSRQTSLTTPKPSTG